MNTNLYDREGFQEKVVRIRTEADRDDCLKLLVDKPHLHSNDDLRKIITGSSAFLYCHPVDSEKEMRCFALVVKRRGALEILLVDSEHLQYFEDAILHTISEYAARKNCKKMKCVPKTLNMHNAFLRYGFSHYFGIRGMNELLTRRIGPLRIRRRNRTRRVWPRLRPWRLGPKD